jgi:hypothetical protein
MTTPIPPSWLPEIVPFSGDWGIFINKLYSIFEKDFKLTRPIHAGRSVLHDSRKEPSDGYGFEEGFWHLTTKDELIYDSKTRTNRKNRVPDFRHAERLPWCSPLINSSAKPEVLTWEYQEENGQIRTYIWLRDQDYVAILRPWETVKYGTVWMLVTAFYLDYNNARTNMQIKYERRK